MMDKVRKPSNFMCYTPSSEPYRIYSFSNYLQPSFIFSDLGTNITSASRSSITAYNLDSVVRISLIKAGWTK
jgi:hypothetical protein